MLPTDLRCRLFGEAVCHDTERTGSIAVGCSRQATKLGAIGEAPAERLFKCVVSGGGAHPPQNLSGAVSGSPGGMTMARALPQRAAQQRR
jgi:hypothetical protein